MIDRELGWTGFWYAALIAAFAIVLWVFAPGCAQAPVVPETMPSPTESSGGTNPAQGGAIVTGWSPAYSAFIEANVPATLLAYPPESVCPKYKSLSDAGKRTFWADWLQSTAAPESGFDRLQMFYEGGIGDPDGVTGLHNVSEGLLQVSYGDTECKGTFDYQKDKAAYLDDYSRAKLHPNDNVDSKHPERSILDPYKNLQCGIRILNYWLAGKPNTRFEGLNGAGSYWSSVRDGKVKSHFDAHFAGSVGCR